MSPTPSSIPTVLHVLFDPETGVARRWSTGAEDMDDAVAVPIELDPHRLYLTAAGEVRELPAAPGPGLAWDRATASWHDPRPAAEVLEEARRGAMEGLVAWLDAQATLVSGPVPEAERLTWDAKETAAQAILSGAAEPGHLQLLAIEAALVGEDVEELAGRVLANAALFRVAGPALAGVRRRAALALAAAATPEAVHVAAAEARALLAAILADPAGFAADPAAVLAPLP